MPSAARHDLHALEALIKSLFYSTRISTLKLTAGGLPVHSSSCCWKTCCGSTDQWDMLCAARPISHILERLLEAIKSLVSAVVPDVDNVLPDRSSSCC